MASAKVALVLVLVTLCVMAIQANTFVPKEVANLEKPKGSNCVCMYYQNCYGQVDNTVQCHPSYVTVCCVPGTTKKPPTLLQRIMRQ